jgi:hypothetical protein
LVPSRDLGDCRAANVSATILAFSSEDQWQRRLPLAKISTRISQ